ncbi:MAG: endonuclease V, partial [Gemmatimonadetes bacterium]|nr:endonuclease V [Gemmatimonadota bacterium]NIR77448.1 endonuclease V [Gemmatimonadota bacterium]NIT85972.1 endonuclease V [Gemmatimonadota bacterium]NIU33915.1 endonuclease V [Gemmatimonadota bacterium]NIU34814.1 endonuclease V [Gemmatimonadota bacterium]
MPDYRPLHGWDVSTDAAKTLQLELRDRVTARTPSGFSPRLVAGADLSIVRGRDRGYAALVVVDAETMETVEEATATVEVAFPYVPGLLSFRELPPLAAAWRRLESRPDAVIFDAHGYAHPRRFGLACHGGLLFGVPSVGVAKSVLVGEAGDVDAEKGDTAPLVHEGERVGTVLRSRTDVRPVYVSVGHRIDLETAVQVVLAVTPLYRLPEPIRR